MPGIGIGISPHFQQKKSLSSYCTPQWLIGKLQEDIAIWNNFDAIWLFSRISDKENYLVELKGSGRDATKQGSGDLYFDDQYGVYSDGDAALNLNHNPDTHKSALSLTSASIGYYLVDEVYGSNGVVGVYDGSTYMFGSGRNAVNSRVNYAMNSAGIDYKVPASARGLVIINRDGTTVELTLNGVSLGTSTRTATAIPSKNLWGLVYNNNDGAIPSGNPTLSRIGLIFVAGKWTPTQITTLNSIFGEYFAGIGADAGLLSRSTTVVDYQRKQWITVFQSGDKILARGYNQMRYSSDNGENWTNYTFTNAGQVSFGYIWANGNITFGTYTKVYFSNNGLSSVSELTIKDTDGVTDYTIHTPVSGTYPGEYFRPQAYPKRQYIDSNEVLVIGNYANVQGGAAPVNVYHFYNNGANVKLAYKFGQNPYYRDDGTSDGGTTGNLLGDSGNSEWCRHVHIIQQDPDTGTFYMCTGDSDRTEQNEVKWFTGTYNTGTETWAWTKIYEGANVDRMKAIGLVFVNGYIWWGSDDTYGTDYGIYRCAKADIATLASHQRMYLADNVIVGLDITDGKLIATKQASGSEKHAVITSNDLSSFTVSDLIYIPGIMPNFYPIIPVNTEGYFCLIPFSASGVTALQPPIHVKVK